MELDIRQDYLVKKLSLTTDWDDMLLFDTHTGDATEATGSTQYLSYEISLGNINVNMLPFLHMQPIFEAPVSNFNTTMVKTYSVDENDNVILKLYIKVDSASFIGVSPVKVKVYVAFDKLPIIIRPIKNNPPYEAWRYADYPDYEWIKIDTD